jgi:UDP-glucose:(heptosyl)LPS alpha-1,3-glucosyltransferase
MTHPLSIALIRQRYAQDGGAERFVARALDALKGQNVRATLITREWSSGADFEVLTCNPLYLGRVWRDWSFARRVCSALEQRRFDLVQSHERIACCDLYRAGDGVHREWLSQLRRVRGPVGRFGLAVNPYHRYVKVAERRLFTAPTLRAVICNSNMVKEEIQRHFGTAEDKLRVIYSGVDTEAYHPHLKTYRAEVRARHAIPDGAPLFLFVGSGFERKGLAAVLAAMAALPGNVRLIVVGRDRKLERYARVAHRSGIAERVLFLGSQADVRPYYGAADALVLPTLYDPFPNVALEAMAAGLAMVTSTKSGAAELIENGRNGFVCDALDHEGLVRWMKGLLVPGLRERVGEQARATVAGMTLDRMGRELARLYQELTKGRSE